MRPTTEAAQKAVTSTYAKPTAAATPATAFAATNKQRNGRKPHTLTTAKHNPQDPPTHTPAPQTHPRTHKHARRHRHTHTHTRTHTHTQNAVTSTQAKPTAAATPATAFAAKHKQRYGWKLHTLSLSHTYTHAPHTPTHAPHTHI